MTTPERYLVSHVRVDAKEAKADRETAAELNGRVDSIRERRRDLADRAATLKADTDMLPSEAMDAGGRLRFEGWDIDGDELQLCRDIRAFLDDRRPRLAKLLDKAYQSTEDTKAKVRAALVSIGYADADRFEVNPSKIQPAWVHAHPDVIAAVCRHNELRQLAHHDDYPRRITARIQELEQRLATARRDAIGAI